MLESDQYINQLFDHPIFVDARTLDSYVHWSRLIWSNLILCHMLIKILFGIKRPLEYHIDDILDDDWVSLVVIKINEDLFILINKMEAPCDIFHIFVIFLASFLFWICRPNIIWDINFQAYEEFNAIKKEHPIEFLIDTKVTYNIIERQHYFS